jgi:hypothetical protein
MSFAKEKVMDQKFEILLLLREGDAPADLVGFAKHLFAEMKGCTVSSVDLPRPKELRVKMLCSGMEEPATNRVLRSFVGIITERRSDVKLVDVRSAQVGGVYRSVNKILGPIGGPFGGQG